MSQVDEVLDALEDEADAYRNGADRPLGGYVLVMATFAAVVAAAAGLAVATKRRLPAGPGAWEVLLLAAGTHKLSRMMSKNSVTAPLRAPFTRYVDNGGPAEVIEEVRATNGWRHAVGELVSCPFCLDVWIATGFTIGHVFAPRATKLVLGALTALTGAEFLHLLYAKAQQVSA
ncbi:MAG: DUF1360 domain-containing protein [Actinomycetota bacterium]|nr:DUF1360 domain-containing protein [Actinomycetota bacterium]